MTAQDWTVYRMVLTHPHPHLDEIWVYWALLRLLDVKGLKLGCWTTDKTGPEAEKALANLLTSDPSILAVGIGGGELDEHPRNGKPGKKDECAATLAAKAFGLADKPELARMLRYVTNQDLKGGGSPFDLASGVRILNLQHPNDPMVAVNWAVLALDAFYAKEHAFQQAITELTTRATRHTLNLKDRKVVIASIESDNPAIQNAARFAGIGVVVQRQPSGNVQIFTDKNAGLPSLDDVAHVLVVAEHWKKGQTTPIDWKELGQEGVVSEAPEWYYHRNGQMILNGSLTTPNTPTQLSLDKIIRAVQIGLDPNEFPERFAPMCKQRRCTSAPHDKCPWWPFGLRRCREMRYIARRQASGQ